MPDISLSPQALRKGRRHQQLLRSRCASYLFCYHALVTDGLRSSWAAGRRSVRSRRAVQKARHRLHKAGQAPLFVLSRDFLFVEFLIFSLSILTLVYTQDDYANAEQPPRPRTLKRSAPLPLARRLHLAPSTPSTHIAPPNHLVLHAHRDIDELHARTCRLDPVIDAPSSCTTPFH